jgi:hypothetical protein
MMVYHYIYKLLGHVCPDCNFKKNVFWRQELAVSVGPTESRCLAEDGDRFQSPKCFFFN